MEDETHVESIPEVEPNKNHGKKPHGCADRIKRFPKEVYVDDERVYYVRDSKDKSYWAQNSEGAWRAMPNPETMDHMDGRDYEFFAADPKQPLVSIYEGMDPDEWIRRHNLIASLENEPLVSMAGANLDCTGEERTTHNTMLLHFIRALSAIIIGMNCFSEGKLHCAVRVSKRIVHACIATITPKYNKAETTIAQLQFSFRIEVADKKCERVTHGFAGVAVAVFAPTEKEKQLLDIDPKDERVVFVVLPTTKKAWNGPKFPENFSISTENMREFYKTGHVPSKSKSHSERLIFAGMCFEKGLRGKVEAAGKKDIAWIDKQKALFPLNMAGRLRKTGHLRQWLPLADALAASRTKRKEKEKTLKKKLASRKVVKKPRVAKPEDWKPEVPPAPKEKKKMGRPPIGGRKRRKENKQERKERYEREKKEAAAAWPASRARKKARFSKKK